MTEMQHEYHADVGASARLGRLRLACREGEAPSHPRPPGLDTLMEWEAQGGCEAAFPHGCWVEPDGTCPHGHPSWLIVMGLF